MYSIYIDTPEYLADTIINDTCLNIEILEEKSVTVNNHRYIVVYVRYNRQYSESYKKFLEILKYHMTFINRNSYLGDSKQIMKGLNEYELFGGNWS